LFDLWQASLPEIFFSKPIRRRKPIERPAEEARLELQCTENLPLITVDQMQQELREINTNKALGPYDPFMKILKTFSKCFALPLTEVFNESFQLKIFSQNQENI
jgi:hypothetical protein